MPIRFRCVYCDQLLGIAHRKAGTVVKCPKCAGQLIVPTPEGTAPPSAGNDDSATEKAPADPNMMFERSDFDELLRPSAGGGTGTATAVPKLAPAKPAANPFDLDTLGSGSLAVAPPRPVAPAPAPPQPVPVAVTKPLPTSGIMLTPLRMAVLLVLLVISLAGAFGAGIVVGTMLDRSANPPGPIEPGTGAAH